MMRNAKRSLSTLTCLLGLILLQFWGCGLASAQGTANVGPGAAAAGYFRAATAVVFVRIGNGPEVRAKVGDVIRPGSSIRTSGPGNVLLLFADGQMVSLSKDAVFRIDEFRYDPANPANNRATFNLIAGSMSYVSGAIHTENPPGLRISAGGAVINIVNTGVVAFVTEVDSRSRAFFSAAVTIGEISIETRTGRIPRIAADQFVRVPAGAAPGLPLPLAAAPASYQAEVAASRANVSGSVAPIDIQSAAIQAALALARTGNAGRNQNALAAGVSGTLNMVVGPVFLRRESGVVVQAKIGDEFGPGALISTGTGGRVGLLFAQGEYAALETNSSLRISSGGNNVGDPANEAPVGLLSGRMSFVTWTLANGQSSRLNLAVGDGFVSSTGQGVVAFVAEIDPNAPGSGSIAVTAGEISFRTQGRAPIIILSGEFTNWQPGGGTLQTRALNQASTSLQTAFTDSLQSASGDAEVTAALASLPATAAGAPQTQTQTTPQVPVAPIAPVTQTQPPLAEPVAVASVIVPAVSQGGGRGCVGSPC